MNCPVLTRALPLLMLCALVTGCQESRIRAYTVPAERPAATAMHPPHGMDAPHAMDAPRPEAPEWQLPAGWQEQPGTGMRFATLIVEPGEKPLEIRVTALAPMARDALSNVNRWRDQIGLPPVSEGELGSMVRPIDAGGRSADLVNITGEKKDGAAQQQILAAILPGDSQVWFFLMMDETARVSRHTADFEAFVKGVRLTGGAPPVETTVAATPGSSAPETMTWDAPVDWVQDPNPGDMRVATFRFADAAGEVAITRFPGDVGGLLANINRWRNQLSLAPVADPREQPADPIQVAGTSALLFDISADGGDASRQRMFVAFLQRNDMSWFIKMTGPHELLDRNRKAYAEFLQTIRLRSEMP